MGDTDAKYQYFNGRQYVRDGGINVTVCDSPASTAQTSGINIQSAPTRQSKLMPIIYVEAPNYNSGTVNQK